ncbi:TOBE domain-containing protein, partial [Klebsiella pneumoniae]
LCGMAGSWALRPEHVRLLGGGEVQVQAVVQAVQYQGAATRIELRHADGDKLLVSQDKIDRAAAASVPRTGQIQQAPCSRSA